MHGPGLQIKYTNTRKHILKASVKQKFLLTSCLNAKKQTNIACWVFNMNIFSHATRNLSAEVFQ